MRPIVVFTSSSEIELSWPSPRPGCACRKRAGDFRKNANVPVMPAAVSLALENDKITLQALMCKITNRQLNTDRQQHQVGITTLLSISAKQNVNCLIILVVYFILLDSYSAALGD